jgi:AcrR family transcriptional regulator
LEAGASLLRERPWSEVTITAIMEKTDLTREAFYAYFRDRHELMLRLVLPLRGELDRELEVLRDGQGDVIRDAKAPLTAVARLYIENRALLRGLADAARADAEAKRAWADFTEPAVQAICERLRREIEIGNLREFDVEGYVRILVGMNLAAFFGLVTDEAPTDVDELVAKLHSIWTPTLATFAT